MPGHQGVYARLRRAKSGHDEAGSLQPPFRPSSSSGIIRPDRIRPRPVCRTLRLVEFVMTITLGHLAPIVALICGILILIMPRLLNFIVAIYLIFVGLTGLFPHLLK